jgi:hypothetical protein
MGKDAMIQTKQDSLISTNSYTEATEGMGNRSTLGDSDGEYTKGWVAHHLTGLYERLRRSKFDSMLAEPRLYTRSDMYDNDYRILTAEATLLWWKGASRNRPQRSTSRPYTGQTHESRQLPVIDAGVCGCARLQEIRSSIRF